MGLGGRDGRRCRLEQARPLRLLMVRRDLEEQQQRLWRFGNKKERERAKTMELHSCDKLQKLRRKQSETTT